MYLMAPILKFDVCMNYLFHANIKTQFSNLSLILFY